MKDLQMRNSLLNNEIQKINKELRKARSFASDQKRLVIAYILYALNLKLVLVHLKSFYNQVCFLSLTTACRVFSQYDFLV